MHVRPRLLFAWTALVLGGCAGASWEQARRDDTPAAYRRFLAENPRSPHAEEARERLASLQLERNPSREALDRFRQEYPDSTELPALERRLEKQWFEAARVEATPVAYERFLEQFASGELSARARGDAEYLRAGGFAGRPDALARFLEEHSQSDYAAEARRSLAALEMRNAARIDAVVLSVEIAEGVPDAERLRKAFTERAEATYAAAGLTLSPSDRDGATRLTIRHDERTAPLRDESGRLAGAGLLADTEVKLQRDGEPEPIFSERFTERVADRDRGPGDSILFTRAAEPYWERFYVPIATWPTQAARRAVWVARMPLAAADGDVGRAIVLSPDGSFQYVDLADPAEVRIVGSYRRDGSFARFSGVRSLGDRIVLFGEDGVEIVEREGTAYRRVAAYDRGAVGAVAGVEEVDGRLLIAGTRGLVRVELAGAGNPERLVERPLRGLARSGDALFVIDNQWLYAGSARNPVPISFFTAGEFGRGHEPSALRVADSLAVVVGERGVACFELTGAGSTRALAHPRSEAIGSVVDAAIVGGSVFLIGERGLQVLDPSTGRVVDSIDVDGRRALGVAGGHLVAVGDDRLEVIDATPWLARSVPAAPER